MALFLASLHSVVKRGRFTREVKKYVNQKRSCTLPWQRMYWCTVYRDVMPPSGAFSLCGCPVWPESGTSCHIRRIYTSLLLTEIRYYNTYHDKH